MHIYKSDSAQKELETLRSLYELFSKEKNKALEGAQVAVQIKAGEGWIQYKHGNNDKAIELMTSAADMEDATEKHPVTPCAVIPARELLGELLLEMNKPELAREAFELDLKIHPHRLNGLQGLAKASQRAGNKSQGDLLSRK